MTDDQSSRLKQFSWEELESDFFLAVIFRSGRRFLVQRYFEQQLLSLRSPTLENKWRRALFDLLSKSTGRLFISSSEVTLMNEIYSWHLNASSHLSKAREHLDCLLDLDELLQCSCSISSDKPGPTSPSYLLQPITTLDAASRTIGLWKEQRPDTLTEKVSRKKREISPMLFDDSASTGWLQLDSKLVPYIRKQCDRLLSVDCLLKERLISAADDVTLRGFYLPMEVDDIKRFNQLLVPRSSSYLNLKKQSSLITLDHLLFRLKRLFFIRSLPSPPPETIDDRQVMSFHGGLISVSNQQQRIPFIFIKKQKYIPQLEQDHSSSISTFCVANQDELEYLRLVAFYDYLASEENSSFLNRLLSMQSLVLIPVQCRYHEHSFTSVSLHDFHFHEYQRRTQQQRQEIFAHVDEDQHAMSDGWWQPPKQKRPLNHFKLQRPIFF